MILSVAQDMAKGAIDFALVACTFPRRFLSRGQRREGAVYGVEVRRSLHRGPQTSLGPA